MQKLISNDTELDYIFNVLHYYFSVRNFNNYIKFQFLESAFILIGFFRNIKSRFHCTCAIKVCDLFGFS